MILQPLVENALRHGLAQKVGPGTLTIASRRSRGRAVIEVTDDGAGFDADAGSPPPASGIGLANVRERLRVIYGAASRLQLTSEPGRGTCARVEVPELTDGERASA